MTPLTHSTPHQDLRDWRELDKRVRKFKADQWERTQGFEPFRRFIALELKLFFVMTTIILGTSFYLSKQNDKEIERYLLEWKIRNTLKR